MKTSMVQLGNGHLPDCPFKMNTHRQILWSFNATLLDAKLVAAVYTAACTDHCHH
jgi:hypothetical protein